MFFINNKLVESEKSLISDVNKLREDQYHKSHKYNENSGNLKDTEIFHPNAIVQNDNKILREYKNSDSVVQKLKPKLKRPIQARSEVDNVNNNLWSGDMGVAKNEEELKIKEEGYNTYAFNTLVSLRLGLSRTLPDTRNKECQKLKYADELPSASIIICYYHEELNVLLRTIHSVIERTPASVLKEVLVINDQSDIDIAQNVTTHLGTQFIYNAMQMLRAK